MRDTIKKVTCRQVPTKIELRASFDSLRMNGKIKTVPNPLGTYTAPLGFGWRGWLLVVREAFFFALFCFF